MGVVPVILGRLVVDVPSAWCLVGDGIVLDDDDAVIRRTTPMRPG